MCQAIADNFPASALNSLNSLNSLKMQSVTFFEEALTTAGGKSNKSNKVTK